ncbi:MAG: trypsin, partial [Planctomycetes bacterium]|nr:trypsin [Planctomycetota bacterium]
MKVAHIAWIALLTTIIGFNTPAALAKDEGLTEGRLDAFDPGGKPLGACPLKHTEVTVDVAGLVARVTVNQQFHNPFADKIEAVYAFPLSQDAAVDRMTMTVGDRVIKGEIKERGEARAIYEAAKAAGNVASLLDQERPNIFTQSVANIEPGEKVVISISYSETLDWEDALYQFDFPLVVGPRYIPGGGSSPAPMTPGRQTPQVPDADRITPPVVPEGARAGHDVSITVNLDAGLPIRHLESLEHQVSIEYLGDHKTRAVVKLKDRAVIPNKDFVLEYQTAGEKIADT